MRVLSWIARVTLVLFAVRIGRRRPAARPAPAKPATPPDPDGQKELSEASSAELVASTFSVDESIGRLFERQLPGGLDPSIQHEMARLLNLVHDVEKSPEQRTLIIPIQYAITALLLDPANLVLAQEIRKDIVERVRAVPVLRGLGLLVVLVAGLLPLVLALLPRTPRDVLGFDSSTLLLVIVGGALGSVVSILTRIRDFVLVPERATFWTGLFRPIIGVGSALFLYFMLQAGLVPTEIQEGRENAFFAAMAFAAGFSERLARDVARRTEDQLTPATRVVAPPSGIGAEAETPRR